MPSVAGLIKLDLCLRRQVNGQSAADAEGLAKVLAESLGHRKRTHALPLELKRQALGVWGCCGPAVAVVVAMVLVALVIVVDLAYFFFIAGGVF